MYKRIITIFAFLAVICQTASANLLTNPNFDQASHGWSKVGHGFTIKKDITTGNIGLFLNPTKEQTMGAKQVVNVASSAPSVVSVSASSLNEYSAGANPTLHVVIVDMSGKKTFVSTEFDNSAKWTTSSVQQIVSSVATVEVTLTVSDQAAVWFDDVTVTVKEFNEDNTYNEERILRSVDAYDSYASTASMATTTTTAPSSSSSSSTIKPITTSTYVIGLKYLILAYSSTDIRLGVVTQTFDSVGSQYDILYPSTLNNASLNLTNSDGSGKYLGIVFCTDVVGATDYQTQEIDTYLVIYAVKRVVFYTYPYTIYGLSVSSNRVASAANATVTFAPASSKFISGYNTSVEFTLQGIWSYPAVITNTTIATPALYVQYQGDANQYVVAAFVNEASGVRSLQFFNDQATWSAHSVGYGSFWLQWLSNNMYLGLRRIYLNCHADDLFLWSNEWDTSLEISSETIIYRINVSDITEFALFLNATNKALPAGSNVTLSFPFNGQGVAQNGGYEADPLYLAVKTPEIMWSFVFEQHTYTHPELTNLTYDQVATEMRSNLEETTFKLFGGYNHPRYSNNSMVTPSISGLFNGEALRALWDFGIRHIVGDNSQPALLPSFQYHGWYTNVTVNGFAGMHIVPREATYIYYDCSTDEEAEGEYNHIYLTYYGAYSTLNDIVTREGKRVALLLLAFRQDPYMFHQENVRQFHYAFKNGATTTLLKEWIEAVVAEYLKYLVLPLQGHNHQLLSQKWVNREQRDACGFTGSVTVNTNNREIISVQGSSTATCDIAITGVTPSSPQAKLSVETYGPDSTTWVNMAANTFQFNVAKPVPLMQ